MEEVILRGSAAIQLLDVLMYFISVGMRGNRRSGQKKEKDNVAHFWHLNVKGLWDILVYSRCKLSYTQVDAAFRKTFKLSNKNARHHPCGKRALCTVVSLCALFCFSLQQRAQPCLDHVWLLLRHLF